MMVNINSRAAIEADGILSVKQVDEVTVEVRYANNVVSHIHGVSAGEVLAKIDIAKKGKTRNR